MALTALTHKRLASFAPSGNTVEQILDDIATALAATQYYDGSGRTAGSGQAWTATKEISGVTVALRLHPPSGSGATGLAAVLAGVDAGAPTPTMLDNDTFLAGALFGGCFRNVPGSPTWNGWDNASPYAGADFTGHGRILDTGTHTIDSILIIESDESIYVSFEANTGDRLGGFHAGAIVEAPRTDEGEVAERVYGLMKGDALSTLSSAFWISTTTQSVWYSSSTANRNKFFLFDTGTPGDSLIEVQRRQVENSVGIAPNEFVSKNGARIGWPLYALNQSNNQFVGVIREVFMVEDTAGWPVVQDTGVDKMHIVGYDKVTVGDAFGFGA